MQTIESLTELLRMAHERIGTEVAKNAELEKDLSNAQTMGDKEQSIRDLEQQARVIDMSILAIESDECKDYLPSVYLTRLYNDLTSQAKELKEQS